jgi:hypothetical protein
MDLLIFRPGYHGPRLVDLTLSDGCESVTISSAFDIPHSIEWAARAIGISPSDLKQLMDRVPNHRVHEYQIVNGKAIRSRS